MGGGGRGLKCNLTTYDKEHHNRVIRYVLEYKRGQVDMPFLPLGYFYWIQ